MHNLHNKYGEYGRTETETFEFTDETKRLRHYLYEYFLEHARCPDLATIRADLQFSQHDAWEALHQLERANFVSFVPGTEDIVKVPPFSAVSTRHKVTAEGGRTWYAGCAGEACGLNGLLPGVKVTVTSTCPDCWEPIVFEARDREFLSIDPEDAVIHVGTPPASFPDDWIVTCDSINFFRSAEHAAVWEQGVPHRRGVTFPIQKGLEWSSFSATVRYWDYDRPPNTLRSERTTESLRALGADVSVWE